MKNTLPTLKDKELARGCERNMRHWYLSKLQAAGGTLYREHGLIWGHSSIPSLYHGLGMNIPFPQVKRAEADFFIKNILQSYRRKKISPWCTFGLETTPRHIRQNLRSWGFVYRFINIGMACPVKRLKQNFKTPRDVKIDFLKNPEIFDRYHHPTYGALNSGKSKTALKVNLSLSAKRPPRAWNIVATVDGDPVGFITLLAGGGVVGLYDLGVKQSVRRKNVGTALFLKACQLARELGFKTLILQANPGISPFFQRFGFKEVTIIQYWNYPREALQKVFPSVLERQRVRKIAFWPNEDLITALNRGDEQAAINLLKAHPALVTDSISGTGSMTVLHLAAWHGLTEVTEALIDLGADLEAREDYDGGTPLSWAVSGFGRNGPLVKRDQLGCARALLKAGASAHAANKWNRSPLELSTGSMDKILKKHITKENMLAN